MHGWSKDYCLSNNSFMSKAFSMNYSVYGGKFYKIKFTKHSK